MNRKSFAKLSTSLLLLLLCTKTDAFVPQRHVRAIFTHHPPPCVLCDSKSSCQSNSSPTQEDHELLLPSSWHDDVFTQETCDLIARQVQKHMTISIAIPAVIIDLVVSQVIRKLTSELNPSLQLELRQVLEAEETISEYDDDTLNDNNKNNSSHGTCDNDDNLADRIAAELNGALDAPLLNEAQELDLLKTIVRIILTVLTTSQAEAKEQRIEASLQATRSLLLDRDRLVRLLNDAVDVPFLDETQERTLLLTAVGTCAEALERLLPSELLESLLGEGMTNVGLAEMKRHLVQRLVDMVDLSFFLMLSKEKEILLFQKLVDVVFEELVGNTEAEFVLMNRQERMEALSGATNCGDARNGRESSRPRS